MQQLNLDRLRQRLLAGGVAPKYARRTITEIDSHISALKDQATEQGLSAAEAMTQAHRKLGDEDLIVSEVLAKPELQSWSRRYTKSVFIAGPILLYLAAAVLLTLFIAGLVPSIFGYDIDTTWPSWYQASVKVIMFIVEYLLTPLIVLAMCALAKKRNINLFWPMIGILFIAFVGSGWETLVEIPTQSQRGNISLHWGYAFMPWYPIQSLWSATLEQVLRIAFTMMLAIAVLKNYQPRGTPVE